MKRIDIVLIVACAWMGTVDAKSQVSFIQSWNPTSAYEKSLRSHLQEIENNPAVQDVAEKGLSDVRLMNMASLKKASEYYQWGITLLEKSLKRNYWGSNKIKKSSDRKELKALLEWYIGAEKIIAEAITSKVMKKVALEEKLAAALFAREQEVLKSQEMAEEIQQEVATAAELELLVKDLRMRHRAEELEDEIFIQEWQEDSSFISHQEYLALIEEIASAIESAQKLHQENKEEDREALEAQWRFLYDWYNALQSSKVKPTTRESFA